jgi:dihydroflavonol-4-reductase
MRARRVGTEQYVRRALVVGGSGFIGSNIVEELLGVGVNVRVTRHRTSPRLLVRDKRIEVVDASLDDGESLRHAIDGCDTVFFSAGHYPRYSTDLSASLETAVRGVDTACKAALAVGVERFVYTSSVGSLARVPAGQVATETDIPEAMPRGSVYRAVKWAMERKVEQIAREGLPAVTVLPGGCLGPGDLRLGTGAFIIGIATEKLPWWVDGEVNLVDVGDVAKAHLAAAAAPAGSRFCIAGHTVRVGWLLRHVAERFGGAVPALELSADQARTRADDDERAAAPKKARVALPRELVDTIADGQPVSNDRAEKDLGVRLSPLDRMLDRAHAWYVRVGFLPHNEPRRTDERPV